MTKEQWKKLIWHLFQALLIFGLTILFAYVVHDVSAIQTPALFMIYLLGILIIILQTSSLTITILSSVLYLVFHAIMFYNVDDFHKQSFILSSIMFIFIAAVITVLNLRLQHEMQRSKQVAATHKRLFSAIEGLIEVQGQDNIVQFAEEALSKLTGRNIQFCLGLDSDESDAAKKWCFRNSAACGYGEVEFSDRQEKFIPIRSNRKTIGVVVIDCAEGPLDKDTLDAIYPLMSQLVIAIDRNKLEEQNKKDSAVYAREKIKGTVMKNLSHDMYPRINKIHQIAGELKNQTALNQDVVDQQLEVIEREAQYLSETVDNIFDITKK